MMCHDVNAKRASWLAGGVLGLCWSVGVAGCGTSNETRTDGRALARLAADELPLAPLPGTVPFGVEPTRVQFGSVVPVVTETGLVSLSVDGLGTLDAEGELQIDKPEGATVRRAFLAAASAGRSGRQLVDGDVTIDGAPVSWLITTQSSIGSWNHWAEVTELVAPKLDAAAPGLVAVTLGEVGSASIDGEILAVIYDEPARADVSTVALLFGAQQVQGDTFNVRLSDPIDLASPNLRIDFSLGIAFGYLEGPNNDQFSVVDVNGRRVTSSAGGQDDGVPANGALLTVGGVGDDVDNPPPDALPPDTADNTRFDDELYDLRPFAQTGDSELAVFTQNPSNDDNIFFSALLVSGVAVIGEGIVLGPTSARDPVGASHTLTARLQDAVGRPVADRDVTFTVLAGPNDGETASVATDAAGEADFELVGDGGPGVDEIRASFVDSRGVTQFSTVALEEWFSVAHPPLARCQVVSRSVDDTCSVDVVPTDIGTGTTDPDGDPLAFGLEPPGPFGLGTTLVTLTVADNSGLSASCTAEVTVVDATAPTLGVPDSVTVGCAPPSGAPVAFETTAVDNCGVATLDCVDGAGRLVTSGATFPLGSSTVTCNAADASGNETSGAFTVSVTGDEVAPTLHCNAPEVVSGDVTVTATASDGCSAPVTVEVTGYRCWSTNGQGQRVVNDDACAVSAAGADLIIEDAGCSSGWIGWTLRAVDASGNETTQDCEARVEGRGPPGSKRGHEQHQGHDRRHEPERRHGPERHRDHQRRHGRAD